MGLRKFRNRKVARVAAKITKSGDGLSEPLRLFPKEPEIGDEVYILLRTRCMSVKFEEIDSGDPNAGLQLVPTFETKAAVWMQDVAECERIMKEQDEQIDEAQRAEAEANGGLPWADPADDPENQPVLDENDNPVE